VNYFGTAGHDNIVGTALADVIDVTQGGRDTIAAGDGDDIIYIGTELTDRDQIDGGAGTDTVYLEGNYFGGVTLGPSTLLGIEELYLMAGYSYTLTLDDANVAAGGYVTISAALLDAGENMVLDVSAETDVALLDIYGGRGDDVIIGGASNVFRLGFGGSDHAIASAGGDSFYMDAELSSGDTLVGGFGQDTVWLFGDYSAGLEITGSMFFEIDRLEISASFDTDLVIRDEVIQPLDTLTVHMNSLFVAPGHTAVVDGSAETDGKFDFFGGVTDDTFLGGALDDEFRFETADQGGDDIVQGNGGDDAFTFGGYLTRNDQVGGGDGFDTLTLKGDYGAGVDCNSTTITELELIVLTTGFDYSLTVGNNNVRADGFTVDGDLLGSADTLAYDGSAESTSGVAILGGLGADTITTGGGDDTLMGEGGHDSLSGGAGDDTISGALGADTMDGGLGADRMRGGLGNSVFIYDGAAESTGAGRDWVDVLKPLKDKFDLDVAVTAVDPKVNAGALSEASFDVNLAAALGAGQLSAGHAVVFRPNAGDLAGHFFLVVDANGVAGYQAGADYVMEFADGSHPNSFAAGFFI
jgi:Ca2+-binding RTX toxin-like protein